MKPVFIESTIEKLKKIINDSSSGGSEIDVSVTVDAIESDLKEYKDNKENTIFLYGASALVLFFSAIVIYKYKASWPLMFIVVWVGAFLYYKVTERNLINESLSKKSLITPHDPVPKMDYLLSGIDLKIGRKETMAMFLSLTLSSAVMMAHLLFVDSTVTINMVLLLLAIVASFFFWRFFYKEDIQVLRDMRDNVNQLKSTVLLGRYNREKD